MSRQIAIIGSGPAGCYAAEGLSKAAPELRIDLLDALPSPFGLLRAGVAPDHQGTKNVARVLERTLRHKSLRFFGNITVGRDLPLELLLAGYDAVILATGAPVDKTLHLPGEDLPGVLGSGALTRWYNGDPGAPDCAPLLRGLRAAVLIGHGNVAVDVARVLCKTAEERAGSDFAGPVEDALDATALEEIHLVGRRSARETNFTPHVLAELGNLARAVPLVDAASLPPPEELEPAQLAQFRAWTTNQAAPGKIALRFHFHATPAAFVGGPQLEGLRLATPAGEAHLAAGLAVRCIGFSAAPLADLTRAGAAFAHQGGKIRERLYVTGWAGRGSSGTVATNRAEAHAVAKRALEETGPSPSPLDLGAWLTEKGIRFTTLDDWKRIDTAEIAGARPGRVREKLRSVEAMLDLLAR